MGMDLDLKAKWVAELRSGKFAQAEGAVYCAHCRAEKLRTETIKNWSYAMSKESSVTYTTHLTDDQMAVILCALDSVAMDRRETQRELFSRLSKALEKRAPAAYAESVANGVFRSWPEFFADTMTPEEKEAALREAAERAAA